MTIKKKNYIVAFMNEHTSLQGKLYQQNTIYWGGWFYWKTSASSVVLSPKRQSMHYGNVPRWMKSGWLFQALKIGDSMIFQTLETWLGWFTRKGKIWTSWSCWCGRFLTDETNSELAQMFFPKHRFSNKLRRPLPLSNRANNPPHSAFSSHSTSAPCSVESASSELL